MVVWFLEGFQMMTLLSFYMCVTGIDVPFTSWRFMYYDYLFMSCQLPNGLFLWLL
jgi:hypothetical protein